MCGEEKLQSFCWPAVTAWCELHAAQSKTQTNSYTKNKEIKKTFIFFPTVNLEKKEKGRKKNSQKILEKFHPNFCIFHILPPSKWLLCPRLFMILMHDKSCCYQVIKYSRLSWYNSVACTLNTLLHFFFSLLQRRQSQVWARETLPADVLRGISGRHVSFFFSPLQCKDHFLIDTILLITWRIRLMLRRK